MTLDELIEAVQEVIQDSVFTEAKITTMLNRGLKVVAKGVLLPDKYQLTPPLPDLYSVDTVDTALNVGVCDLPLDYQRDLVQVVNESYDDIPIVPSFRKFLKQNPKQDAGSVRICSPHGKTLLYRDIPSTAETLTVHYYQTPTLMEDGDDEPTGIPEHLQYQILVGFACSYIFNLIEDGMEGQKLNTMEWRKQYYQGLAELEIELGFDALADQYEDLTERID